MTEGILCWLREIGRHDSLDSKGFQICAEELNLRGAPLSPFCYFPSVYIAEAVRTIPGGHLTG